MSLANQRTSSSCRLSGINPATLLQQDLLQQPRNGVKINKVLSYFTLERSNFNP